ncbi:MAG: M2 family metallopeptidase [Candidatus Krumholzibacteriia bacterium]
MNSRSAAGLVMLLLAAALMAVFFLEYDPNAVLQPGDPESPPAELPSGGMATARVDSFLADFNAVFQALKSASLRTGFRAAVEGGRSLREAASDSQFVLDAYCGSRTVLQSLGPASTVGGLSDRHDRQIQAIRREAMRRPAVLPSIRLEALDAAMAWPESLALARHDFRPPGRGPEVINFNGMAMILASSTKPALRKAAWEAFASGSGAAPSDLGSLFSARKSAARAIGFPSLDDAVTAGLGLTPEETRELLTGLRDSLAPLYVQFHAALRRDLARTFKEEVPGLLPVTWLEWNLDHPANLLGRRVLTRELEDLTPADMAAHAEELCVSLGMPPLPAEFTLSGVAAVPAGWPISEARAWPVAPPDDLRLTLSSGIEDLALYRKTHAAVARLHSVAACTRAGWPPVLADDPAGVMTAAVAVALDLAARSSAYLDRRLGADAGAAVPPADRILLDGAGDEVFGLYLDLAVRGPWLLELSGAGDAGNDPVDLWWALLARAGLGPDGPPAPSPPEAVLAALGDSDLLLGRALGIIVGHQLHRYVCRGILQQDVHAADYHGHRAAGDFLLAIMRQGRGADWQRILREATGEDPSAQALLDYYRDLEADLQEANAGGTVGWPEPGTGSVNR